MPITEEQLETLFAFIDGHPAAQIDSRLTLPITADNFKERFNVEMIPIVRRLDLDDDRTVTKSFFLLNDWQTRATTDGKIFLNVFGNSAAIEVVTDDSDRIKFVLCAFSQPETPDEKTLASMVLVTLTKVLLPADDVEGFLRKLPAVGNMIVGDMEFSLTKFNGLTLILAAKEGVL